MTPEHRNPPALVLPDSAWSTVWSHLAGEYPDEGCGILVGESGDAAWRITEAVVCENVAEPAERRRRFEIDPRIVLRLQRELRGTGREILGFYHSHPDGEAVPSETDMVYLRLWPRTAWLVVSVNGGEPAEPRAWWLAEPDAASAVELELIRAAGAERPRGDRGIGVPAGARDD